MTDPHITPALAAALATDPHALGDYMDRDVSATSVKITKAGDGLSKQLEVDPMILVPGQTYMVLLEGVAGSHTHKLIDKAGTWELVQELIAKTVTFVDGEDLEKVIRIAADRVTAAAEARKGVQRLDGTNAADLEVPPPPLTVDDIAELEAAAGGRPEPEWDDENVPAADDL